MTIFDYHQKRKYHIIEKTCNRCKIVYLVTPLTIAFHQSCKIYHQEKYKQDVINRRKKLKLIRSDKNVFKTTIQKRDSAKPLRSAYYKRLLALANSVKES
jgi:hypothetical protein